MNDEVLQSLDRMAERLDKSISDREKEYNQAYAKQKERQVKDNDIKEAFEKVFKK